MLMIDLGRAFEACIEHTDVVVAGYSRATVPYGFLYGGNWYADVLHQADMRDSQILRRCVVHSCPLGHSAHALVDVVKIWDVAHRIRNHQVITLVVSGSIRYAILFINLVYGDFLQQIWRGSLSLWLHRHRTGHYHE